jgi:acid phosphatase
MEAERKLGDAMRKRYVTQMKLLPENYLAGTLYVDCSHFDRTIMSAQCLLLGLFPLGTGPVELHGYQPVPIHTEPTELDMMVPDDSQSDGFNFWGLVQSTVFSQQVWQNKELLLKGNFATWNAATGYPINQLYDLKQLGDILDVSQQNNAPLPAGLSSQDISTIIDAGAWAYSYLYQNQQVGEASIATLLHDIDTRLHNATQPNQTQKWMLYSAHSSTLMALLSALGAPLTAVPPYAADFTITLYDQGNQQYILKLTYNDTDVTLPISSRSTCSLDQFHTLAQQAMQQLTTVQSNYPLGSSNPQAIKAK